MDFKYKYIFTYKTCAVGCNPYSLTTTERSNSRRNEQRCYED